MSHKYFIMKTSSWEIRTDVYSHTGMGTTPRNNEKWEAYSSFNLNIVASELMDIVLVIIKAEASLQKLICKWAGS